MFESVVATAACHVVGLCYLYPLGRVFVWCSIYACFCQYRVMNLMEWQQKNTLPRECSLHAIESNVFVGDNFSLVYGQIRVPY